MSCTEHISTQIRERGFRLTPQRLIILQVLQHSGSHLSPGEVYKLASKEMPGLTETTVYRTLEFLSQNGLAFETHVASGKLVYQVASHGHHHLICRACGAEVEVPHTQMAALYAQIEQTSGYRLTTNHLTFFGLCANCQ
jgi:Fe2+ or Zn2+ uptake regulation protein